MNMKEGSLFCFVMLSSLPSHTAPLTQACGILLESSQWVGMDGVGGFIMFSPPVEKLLNIEQFFSLNVYLNKKFTIIGQFVHALDIVGKPLVSKV